MRSIPLLPNTIFLRQQQTNYWLADLESVLHMIGAAATKLRKRLDLNYKSTNDDLGRRFCGLHDTVLPLSSKARSIFQQLWNSTTDFTKNSRRAKQRTDADAAPGPRINGRPNGRVLRVDLRRPAPPVAVAALPIV